MTGRVESEGKEHDGVYVAISVTLFLIGLTQPAFYQVRSDDSVVSSATCLAFGGVGLLAGYIEWLANPLLLYSWIAGLRGRRYRAGVSATLALLCTALFLIRRTMTYPLYEREPEVPIVGHGLGYWLWMLSAMTMAIRFYGALVEHEPE